MKPQLYIVTGISGSGKTTVARHLLLRGEVAFDSKLNPGLYQFVDSDGGVAASVNLQDEIWQKKYKWSLNEKKLEELLERNHDAPRAFLCGRANLYQYWHKADKVFLLKVDAPTLVQRLNSKSRDNLFAKDTVTQRRLVNDLDLVQDKITQKGAAVVNAKASLDDVVSRILQKAH